MANMKRFALPIPRKKVIQFCHRWEISEFSFFGSIVKGSFRDTSDIDILVSYKPGFYWSLFDHEKMEEELQQIFGRKVDLISKKAIQTSRNWIRKEEILQSAVKYYES